MKNVTINLYEFEELEEYAKNKAIEEHREFLISAFSPWDFKTRADYNEWLEHMETDGGDGGIISDIKNNEYLFYKNGELAYTTVYTGGHKKAGTTEFHIEGDTYIIN